MGEIQARPTLWTPAFIALSAAEFAYFTAAGLTIPVVPLFAEGPLGAGALGVGVAFGAFTVTAMMLRPFVGREVDRNGRRRMMFAGAALVAVCLALSPLVGHLVLFVGLRLLVGVGEAAFFVASLAMLADLAPPERMGEATSYNSLALYLGVAFGPLLGETLLDLGGFELAFAGGAALTATAAAVSWWITEPPREPHVADGSGHLIHRSVVLPALGFLTGSAAMSGYFAFVTLYARDLGLSGSRVAMLVFGLVVVLVRLAFARLPDRVPPLRLLSSALLVIGSGMALMATVRTPAGLYLGAAVLAVGIAFMTPAFFTAIMARVSPRERGAAMGTASLFIDLGFGLGPLYMGVVAEVGGIPAAFAVAGVLSCVGALWIANLSRRQA